MKGKAPIFQSSIFRIVVIIIVLVLPINIMTLLLSNIVLQKNKEQSAKEIQNSLEWNIDNFETVMRNATRRLTYLSFDDSSFIALAKDTGAEKQGDQGALLNHTSRTLKAVRAEYPWIDVLYFYFPRNDYLVCAGYPGMSYNAGRDKIKEAVGQKEPQDINWQVGEVDGTGVLIGVNTWNDSDFGMLVNLDRLLAKFNFLEETDGKNIFFTNAAGTIYSANGQKYLESRGMTLGELKASDKFQVFQVNLPQSDLFLVEVVEWQNQMERLPMTIIVLQVLSVMMTILVIPLLLIYVRKWMLRPLNRLVRAMDKIEQGELDYRITSVKAGREFEQINHNFNQMMDQVSELKIDVYEKELDRKNIKVRYLSQQIQSHFILNAMNILYSYEPEEYRLIQKLILYISKYFRYIVKAEDDFVLIKQEMEHIENYFEIQKARYPGLFDAIIEYEADLAYALVPPLLVQNFAENAIKHSIKIGNKLTIFIIAERYEDESGQPKMRIRMADSGEGISDEMLDKIELFRRTRKVQEGMGVGIRNAIERLEYLYGNETKLRIGRDENYSGTNVEIILPLYYADEREERYCAGDPD